MLQNKIDQFFKKRYAKILQQDILSDNIDLPSEFLDVDTLSLAKLSQYYYMEARKKGLDPQVGYNRVLTKFLGGKFVVKLISKINHQFPDAFPKLLVKSLPGAFRWLVGPISVLSNDTGKILSCTYLEEGGEQACIDTCKIPTEFYFKKILGVNLTLEPDFKTKACTLCCKKSTKSKYP